MVRAGREALVAHGRHGHRPGRADAAVFLAPDEARRVAGALLPADGGLADGGLAEERG